MADPAYRIVDGGRTASGIGEAIVKRVRLICIAFLINEGSQTD